VKVTEVMELPVCKLLWSKELWDFEGSGRDASIVATKQSASHSAIQPARALAFGSFIQQVKLSESAGSDYALNAQREMLMSG